MRVDYDENNYVKHILYNENDAIEDYDGEMPEDFTEKYLAYRLVDGVLIFDEDRWNTLLKEEEEYFNQMLNAPTIEERLSSIKTLTTKFEESFAALKIILGVE